MVNEDSTMLEAQEDDDEHSPFPVRLHMVLSEAVDGSCPDLESVVCFQPHGRAFRILDRDSFCVRVLPRLFPTTSQVSWSDFLGQLTRYGFRCLTNVGPDQGAYYHAFFVFGKPELARLITVRRSRSVPSEGDDDEPDFSQFPVCLAHCQERTASPAVVRGGNIGEQALMYEPTVGASTLPPAQFGGAPVLMSLLVPQLSHRRRRHRHLAAAAAAQEEGSMIVNHLGINNYGTTGGALDLRAILDMDGVIRDE